MNHGITTAGTRTAQLGAGMGEFIERYGISIVGGCCGTTPDHIRAIAERCAGLTPHGGFGISEHIIRHAVS